VVCEVFNLIIPAASNLLILQDRLSMTLPLSRYRNAESFQTRTPHVDGDWILAQGSIDLIGF